MNVKVDKIQGYQGNKPNDGRAIIFKHWAIAYPDYLYRSASPYYVDLSASKGDSDRTSYIDEAAALLLSTEGVRALISFNHHRFLDEGLEYLKRFDIKYFHYKTEDYKAPSKEQLIDASKNILKFGNCLCFCGYGQGRTGTLCTAFKILIGLDNVDKLITESTAETPAQEDVLRTLEHGYLKDLL